MKSMGQNLRDLWDRVEKNEHENNKQMQTDASLFVKCCNFCNPYRKTGCPLCGRKRTAD
jgi:hypothetical protein